ncbi:50S ribosomal protein L11 methyltransferase [Candidatus Auribacterota bacterium]
MKLFFKLSLTIPQDKYEIALGAIYSVDTLGLEETGTKETKKISCYFNEQKTAACLLKRLKTIFPKIRASLEQIQNCDWNEKWRQSMKPAKLTKNIWVSPKWLTPNLKDNDIWIKIEPKMAFGTGHHATTRLTAQAMVQNLKKKRDRFLDIGTGSGILCFVAAIFGIKTAIGIEIDPQCRKNLRENYLDNRLVSSIHFFIGNINIFKIKSSFNLITMNMIRTISEPLLDKVYRLLRPSGILIWSGILISEKKVALKAAKDKGFSCLKETTEGDWWCGTLLK